MLIPFKKLFRKYNVRATGVLHIGAHLGQELPEYLRLGLRDIIFVEANPVIFESLKRRTNGSAICLNACISDTDGQTVTFNVSNNEGQSSSILPFGTHTREHPGIVFTSAMTMQTRRIDGLLQEHNLAMPNFVNIDIQGAELMALKGMDLSGVEYLYIEVNEKELYKGCALLPELDKYLAGFKRVETNITPHGWGDAFYIRKPNMVEVPPQFQVRPPITYPSDNVEDFERWYFRNFTNHAGRVYLPVTWTGYYCAKKYGQDKGAIASLQRFLDTLDRKRKYYTIVQYDDGILNDISGLDIKVFSMSGKGDYYLPLLCTPHAYKLNFPRSIFASFVGRITHPVRQQMAGMAQAGWHIETRGRKLDYFCGLLAKSVFSLCPRGYGPTSFRIAEAMQYGSIPVYISDEFVEPHGIDFEEYGVKVHVNDIYKLPEILNQVDIAAKQKAVREYYPKYFTYESNREIIIRESGLR